MQLTKRKNIFIIILSIILVLGAVFLYIKSASEKRSLQVPESNTIPLDSPATLLKSEDLYKNLEINQYEQFRKDLTNYARNYAGVVDNVVTYSVEGSVIEEGEALKFIVVSKNDPQHSIKVVLVKKPNQRVLLSFTDPKNNTSDFDDQLYSNSQKNIYVSTLPIQNVSYSIEYNQQEDKFIIFLYDKNNTVRQTAIDEIKLKSGIKDLGTEDYDIVAPGVFEDSWNGETINQTEGD